MTKELPELAGRSIKAILDECERLTKENSTFKDFIGKQACEIMALKADRVIRDKLDGTLKNAYREGKRVIGNIYGDSKKRFEDGAQIHTSSIVEELPGDIIKTRNSIYKVEWAKTSPLKVSEEDRMVARELFRHAKSLDKMVSEAKAVEAIAQALSEARKRENEACVRVAKIGCPDMVDEGHCNRCHEHITNAIEARQQS